MEQERSIKGYSKENPAIYVHIPFCKSRCGYCAFSSSVNYALVGDYFDVLCDEISHSDSAIISTMYWGGGTPSSVERCYLEKLYQALTHKFNFSHLREFTVECNPESVTKELLEFLKSIGVNRLSFGLQSVNNQTLKKIGRIHTYEDFLTALHLAKQCGFENISADLILGLPETVKDFEHTIQTVVDLPLTHMSLYALEIHENTPFEGLMKDYAFSDDQLADMYDFALEVFARHGFSRYEISNFSKPSYQSQHNLTYWRENRYFGFGASASGFVGHTRYGNAFRTQKYIISCAVIKEYYDNISLEEEMREFVMLGLRLAEGISPKEFCDRYGKNIFEVFPKIHELSKKGFLNVEDGKISVPDSKLYVLNSILVELFD